MSALVRVGVAIVNKIDKCAFKKKYNIVTVLWNRKGLMEKAGFKPHLKKGQEAPQECRENNSTEAQRRE